MGFRISILVPNGRALFSRLRARVIGVSDRYVREKEEAPKRVKKKEKALANQRLSVKR